MTDELIEQPGEDLLKLRSDAEKRESRKDALLGFLVAPVLMVGMWFLTGDVETVRSVGEWVFCLCSVVFAVAYTRFSKYSEKLKNVSQQYSVVVRGVLGPVKDNYQTKFDYSRFTTADCKAHRKLSFWGHLCGGSLFALFGWLGTISLFKQFVWA